MATNLTFRLLCTRAIQMHRLQCKTFQSFSTWKIFSKYFWAVSANICLPRTLSPPHPLAINVDEDAVKAQGKKYSNAHPPLTLIERGRGGAGETNAATQMQSKYPPCAVTQNFLSLLLSGLGIEVRNPIREVSVIFVSPLFLRIYGFQMLIETRPWLSKRRKRLFEVVSPFCHI